MARNSLKSLFYRDWVGKSNDSTSNLMDSFNVCCKKKATGEIRERFRVKRSGGEDGCGWINAVSCPIQKLIVNKNPISRLCHNTSRVPWTISSLFSSRRSTAMNVNWQEFVQKIVSTCMLSHVNSCDYLSLSLNFPATPTASPLNCWNFSLKIIQILNSILNILRASSRRARVENWGMKNSNFDYCLVSLTPRTQDISTWKSRWKIQNEMTIWFHCETIFIRIKSLGRRQEVETIEICLDIE